MEGQYGNLFVVDAWIVDISTQTFWKGREEILQRFRSLEEFTTLEHRLDQDPILTSDSSAVAQTMTWFTYIDPETTKEQSYVGHEIWTIDKIDGQWKITSLQVNLP